MRKKTDLFLRRTFGYSNIEPRKQKILLSAVKEYGEVLNKNKGLAKLSDSTGFSMETLGVLRIESKNWEFGKIT